MLFRSNFNTLNELISDDSVYANVFNEYVRSIIFKENQYVSNQIHFGEYYELYEKLYRKHGNRSFSIFLKSFGVLELMKTDKGIENIERIIRKLHNQRTARRHLKELNELVNLYSECFGEITPEFIRRNQELRSKIIIPTLKIAA